MGQKSGKVQRPLSPHLQVYKPQITSVMSILHRITGVFLSIGTLLIAAWISTAAYDVDAHAYFTGILQSTLGCMFLIAWTIAFYYHLCNGIRHIFWDMGKGFELEQVKLSGMATFIGTAVLTAATWLFVWGII